MPKLPVVSGHELVKALTKIGFIHVRTTGSHAILKKKQNEQTIVIPVPLHKELAKGTLLSIMHQARLSREEFMKILK